MSRRTLYALVAVLGLLAFPTPAQTTAPETPDAAAPSEKTAPPPPRPSMAPT